MKTPFKLAAGFAALALSVAAHAAPVDLFSLDQGTYTDQTPNAADTGLTIGSGVGGSVGDGDPTILGGNRDLFVSLLSNGGVAPSDTREVKIGVRDGVLDFSVDTLTRGRGQIQWDGADNTAAIDVTGLGGIDITDAGQLNAFVLGILFSDGGFNFEVTAYTDADTWTRISFTSVAHPTPGNSIIPFSAFETAALCGATNPAPNVNSITCGTDGPADLSKLGALVVDLDRFGGTTSIDLTLDSVVTVPEPGIIALMGIGLMGMVGVSRRRKNQV